MKKYISNVSIICTTLMLLVNGCKKNIVALPPADEINIESWSPQFAEFGDELTIKGSGFNADASKNIVDFWGAEARVIEASPTQLKIIVPDLTNSVNIGDYSIEMMVKANGKESKPVYIFFKRSLSITALFGRGPGNLMLPGDSIRVEGSGFSTTPSKNSIRFNPIDLGSSFGKVTPVRIDSSYWCKAWGFYPSAQCLGQNNSQLADTATLLANLEFTLNGKTVKKLTRVLAFPNTSYQYVSHTTNNGYRFVRIKHKSILPGTMVRWRFPNGSIIESSFAPDDYTDEFKETNLLVLQMNFPPGTYRVTIFRQNRTYLSRDVTF